MFTELKYNNWNELDCMTIKLIWSLFLINSILCETKIAVHYHSSKLIFPPLKNDVCTLHLSWKDIIANVVQFFMFYYHHYYYYPLESSTYEDLIIIKSAIEASGYKRFLLTLTHTHTNTHKEFSLQCVYCMTSISAHSRYSYLVCQFFMCCDYDNDVKQCANLMNFKYATTAADYGSLWSLFSWMLLSSERER